MVPPAYDDHKHSPPGVGLQEIAGDPLYEMPAHYKEQEMPAQYQGQELPGHGIRAELPAMHRQ